MDNVLAESNLTNPRTKLIDYTLFEVCVGSVRCVELQTMSYLVLEKFLNAKVLTRPSFGPRNTAVESTPNKGKTIHFLSSCANNCCHEKKRKEEPKKKSLRAVSPRGEGHS